MGSGEVEEGCWLFLLLVFIAILRGSTTLNFIAIFPFLFIALAIALFIVDAIFVTQHFVLIFVFSYQSYFHHYHQHP